MRRTPEWADKLAAEHDTRDPLTLCGELGLKLKTPATPAGGGQVLFAHKRLFLGAADGAVEVMEVKPQGKKRMDAKAFAAGVQGIKNTVLNWENQ